MNAKKPSVPLPCHAAWDDMIPDQGGRFCGACQKTVIDFTAMSDQEVLALLASSRTTICGRFRNDQLEVTTNTWRDTLFHMQSRAQSIRVKPIRLVSVLLVSLIIIITGCESPSGKNDRTTGNISLDTLPKIDSTIKIDSLPKRAHRTTGVVAMPVPKKGKSRD